MDLGFAGATAVVTGGSKGMGLAIAETLGAEGASVAIMARGQQALERRRSGSETRARPRCCRSASIWPMPSRSPQGMPR